MAEDRDSRPSPPEDDVAGASRYPAHPKVTEAYSQEGPARRILMTPKMSAIGGMLAFFTVVSLVVVLPTATYRPPVDPNWLPLPDAALAGRKNYLANGCVYCHSGFSRPQDVFRAGYYLYPRESAPGDYAGAGQSPNILGTERTGPDLSQEGGMHPDDWQQAHYFNPRFPMPLSIMPSFKFWTAVQLAQTIAFNQSQGGKEAYLRYAAMSVGDRLMLVNKGLLSPNVAFPDYVRRLDRTGELPYKPDGKPKDPSPWGLPWQAVWMVNTFARGYWLTDDPLPLTTQNLMRGKDVYLTRCAGCHGQTGAGDGPAAVFLAPKPFPFSDKKKMSSPVASDGMLYHRMLTAGKGTAMENFGTRLSVDDMWRTVLFLRTIPNGGLEQPVPTPDLYTDWKPSPEFLRYVADHPLDKVDAGFSQARARDPFDEAARWLSPGLTEPGSPNPEAPGYVLVGGQLPITLPVLTELVRDQYFELITEAYQDATRRGDKLPPRSEIFSTEGLEWHMPS